ncbi:MAG: hypothetical protein M3R41_02175 [Pseudomonadota bacterium]|nr:hypothetical protein [Pseudomonadota bacterium]
MMNVLNKAGLGLAIVAATLTAAAPADAQRWHGGYGGGYHGGYHHGYGGGDAAGAALLGGIVGLGVGAAIASSNHDRYYDRGYYEGPPPRAYYYEDNYYRPHCWNQWRWDGYYGRNVPVRVCR